MKKTVLSVLKYILLLSIGVALLILAFKGVDLQKTLAEIKHANLFWLGMSILTSLFAFVSRAYRWNLLIEPLGYKPSLKNTTSALMVGYLANLAVPRLGEVSRCGSLSTAEKIPFDKLLGTVIVERVIDVLSLVAVIFLTVFLQFNLVKNFFLDNLVNPMQAKMAGAMSNSLLLVGLISGVIIIVAVAVYLFKAKTSSKLIIKIREMLKGIIEGVRSVRKIRSIPIFLLHSIFIWVMYYYMAYFCFFSFEATSGLSWQSGLLILVAGGIGMSAPVQGGIGAYHLLVSQGLVIYGVLKEHGIAYATLLHSSQMLVVIIFGALGYLVLSLNRKKIKNADA